MLPFCTLKKCLILIVVTLCLIHTTTSICINGQNDLSKKSLQQHYPKEYEIIKNLSAKYDDMIKSGLNENHPNAVKARIELNRKLKDIFVPKITKVQLDEIANVAKNEHLQKQRDDMKITISVLDFAATALLLVPEPTGISKIIGGILKGATLVWSFIMGMTEEENVEEKKARQELKQQMDALQQSLKNAFTEIDEGFLQIHYNIKKRFAELKEQFIITNFENNNLRTIDDFWNVWESFRETNPTNLNLYCKIEAVMKEHCTNEAFSPDSMLTKIMVTWRNMRKDLMDTLATDFDYGRMFAFVDLLILNIKKITFLNKICGALIGINDAFDKHLEEIADELDKFTASIKREALETITSNTVCNYLLEKQANKSDIVDSNIDSPLRWLQAHYPWYKWYRFTDEYFTKIRTVHYHVRDYLYYDYASGVNSTFGEFFNVSDKNTTGPSVINWSQNACSYAMKLNKVVNKVLFDTIAYKRSHFIGLYTENICGMKKRQKTTHTSKGYYELSPLKSTFDLTNAKDRTILLVLTFLNTPNCTDASCLEAAFHAPANSLKTIEIYADGNYDYNTFRTVLPVESFRNLFDYFNMTDKNMNCIINRDFMKSPQIINNSFSFFYAAIEQVKFSYLGKTAIDTLETTVLCDVESCSDGRYGPPNKHVNNTISIKQRKECLQKFYILEGCF